MVARAWLLALQGMITGMVGDGSVWYGDVRHCRVSTPHSYSHSCAFDMDGPDNNIGADGATALVEGLKEMTNLTQLNLHCECGMVGIVCQVAVMSWIKQVAGVHTGKGQGAKGNNDVGVVTEG